MGSRGLQSIMNSASMIHTSESIKSKDIAFSKRKLGSKYMKDFKRPAYFGTKIQQKDIHGYIKED
jgi:hypothetical protein